MSNFKKNVILSVVERSSVYVGDALGSGSKEKTCLPAGRSLVRLRRIGMTIFLLSGAVFFGFGDIAFAAPGACVSHGLPSFSCPSSPNTDVCGSGGNFQCKIAPTCGANQKNNCNDPNCACVCNSGYSFCGATGTCVLSQSCPSGTTFNACTGTCNTPYVLLNPSAQQNGSMSIDGSSRIGGGGAFGGFAPDATWKVSSPNGYFGDGALGTIIGAGTGQNAGDLTTDGVLEAKTRLKSPQILFNADAAPAGQALYGAGQVRFDYASGGSAEFGATVNGEFFGLRVVHPGGSAGYFGDGATKNVWFQRPGFGYSLMVNKDEVGYAGWFASQCCPRTTVELADISYGIRVADANVYAGTFKNRNSTGEARLATVTQAVYGQAPNGGYGVYGIAPTSGSYGVYGTTSVFGAYGVYGSAPHGSSALYADGDARVTDDLVVDDEVTTRSLQVNEFAHIIKRLQIGSTARNSWPTWGLPKTYMNIAAGPVWRTFSCPNTTDTLISFTCYRSGGTVPEPCPTDRPTNYQVRVYLPVTGPDTANIRLLCQE